jgi:phytoene dehydrogenase-like protein
MKLPTSVDDSLAPPGMHIASAVLPAIRAGAAGWPIVGRRARGRGDHHRYGDQARAQFPASILGVQIHSPLDLERKFGLIGGDIMHGHMSLDQLWAARPVLGHGDYRAPIKGLYMCGAGTHPGGGVTGAPGHNAAHEILRDRSFFGALFG